MVGHVFRMIAVQFKIIGRVILLVPVYMVNHHPSKNRFAYGCLHNNDMLEYISFGIGSWVIWQKNFSISFLEYIGLSAVIKRALHGAILGLFAIIKKSLEAMSASMIRLSRFWAWARNVGKR